MTSPALFVGHGSPMNAIEDNGFARTWAEEAASLPRPRAILCVSAHWETRGAVVGAVAQPETIHDFYGFPRALFDVRYHAPGAPELARRVKALVAGTPVALDPSRGLDHGAWSVLCRMFPAAEIPVCQLSLDTTRPGAWHYALARELAPLRDEGVLILGSGNVVHNLRRYEFDSAEQPDWAVRFRDATNALILSGDHGPLANPMTLGPEAALAIPTPEHYLPLLYVLGVRRPTDRVRLFNDLVTSSLSMTGVRLDPAA
jgi:4,5-DOPA dioxygenase extradiol